MEAEGEAGAGVEDEEGAVADVGGGGEGVGEVVGGGGEFAK